MKAVLKTLVAASLLIMGLHALAAASAGRVVACAGIQDREPVGAAETFSAGTAELYCFSEITGASGLNEVTHVWAKDGVEVFRMTLPVRAERWRSWSKKRVSPGSWTVSVQGPDGAVLGQTAFTVNG